MLKVNTIQVRDCIDGLRNLPDGCVQCCVTSPPYYRLRDYGIEGQYGLEESPEAYIAQMSAVFKEVKRVLKKDGTLWLNIGDAYWGSGKAGYNENYKSRHKQFGKVMTEQSVFGVPSYGRHPEIKAKDLIGIPWMLAFALRKQGWYLRQDIIWHKRNCMPESVTDRCTRAHEYIFLLSRQPHYYFNAEAISITRSLESIMRDKRTKVTSKSKYATLHGAGLADQGLYKHKAATKDDQSADIPTLFKANRRSVWSISAQGIRDKHFAAFPLELPTICIKAASRPGDIILDPFMGAGTTALAAGLLDRYYLGFELNPQYAAIAERRLRSRLGLFFNEQYI